MLWRRTWDETKWRYLTAQLLMLAWTAFMANEYRAYLARGWQMVRLYASSPSNKGWAPIEAAGLNLPRWLAHGASGWYFPLALFAAIIGAGGLAAQSGGRGALFTLSLPVTRSRLLFSRVTIGLAEIACLALVSVAALWLAVHDHDLAEFVSVGLPTAAALFLAQMSVFGLAVWLATMLADVWRPILLAVLGGWALFQAESMLYNRPAPTWISLLPVPDWLTLAVSIGVGAAALLGAWRTLARRDF